ncbi:MAG: hypothetical protein NTX64_01575 [Elusimicrobia bacterium]|nr:hypothetical protein [Elusimicrobiota bacterium]
MHIRYRFALTGGRVKEFDLSLDPASLALMNPAPEPLPEWTRLGNRRCSICPLNEQDHPHCPIAANLAGVIEEFKDSISFHEAEISILTEAREFRKKAALQEGISGLIGIVMVTSGCPVLDKLRPMVRIHMPFPETIETMYRAISMYLLAQFFVYKRGRQPDWDLKHLVDIYNAVSTVNRDFVKRLKTIKLQDASLNALVSLDCFAAVTVISILDDSLQEIENLFSAYLPAAPQAAPAQRT